ncbi:MAG: GntR family transcriptional regulator [Luteococcus sp.]|uniref:GntR family transcriptional regulator n=1 Tax=Luteococcus sp. TaxID=1969402 RepID=UPI0026497B19|nr:GntR family transcriptional regulator [Luteococcus sp.]MDN5564810.1 GntR family transcriptional regulator [Luteococcus sp.]
MNQEPEDARSPYLAVADDLRAAISSGQHHPGEKIPSIAQLADEYGVVASTVQGPLRLLKMTV